MNLKVNCADFHALYDSYDSLNYRNKRVEVCDPDISNIIHQIIERYDTLELIKIKAMICKELLNREKEMKEEIDKLELEEKYKDEINIKE